ncbi:hypothetical protein [Pseudomonas sp. MWU12-2323]|uniref:hypothetical protein n=1 Tax=Pseudomonas sp. MWU12-2323 TaxID=2651296 RepID=UPI00128E8FF0|nr:hypothetical protein [Pseudomonas sp. MWU12-2323]MPQ69286.1 hypothetical protein [Pseudomonas sp. MWU12-2323]
MLIDFEDLHRSYLVSRNIDGRWLYTPTNVESPQTGFFPSTHQVFSNHGLQIALYLYNPVSSTDRPPDRNLCTGVRHCLYLNFTHRVNGKYRLNDDHRVAINLDLGVAGDLYGLAQGHRDSFSYKAIRSGKTPKRLYGTAFYRDGRRYVALRAESSKSGVSIKIEVELDRAALIALAAHCLAYGKLLYPSFSDSVVQTLLSDPALGIREGAESQSTPTPLLDTPTSSNQQEPRRDEFRACAENNPDQPSQKAILPERLRRVIWAIGNRKWTKMRLDALQAIQAIEDQERAQVMIDEANQGNFKSWDAYL